MKPFLLGRKLSEAAPLRPMASPSVLPVHGHRHGVTTEEPATAIEVVKDGDKIVRLIVTCACGERIEVNCLYPAHG